jgi:hypothetical protein
MACAVHEGIWVTLIQPGPVTVRGASFWIPQEWIEDPQMWVRKNIKVTAVVSAGEEVICRGNPVIGVPLVCVSQQPILIFCPEQPLNCKLHICMSHTNCTNSPCLVSIMDTSSTKSWWQRLVMEMTSTVPTWNNMSTNMVRVHQHDHNCKIWGFHGSDYEECRLLRYKNPVCTSHETHYFSTTECNQLMLCKIWGLHGGDYEECHLLRSYTAWLL